MIFADTHSHYYPFFGIDAFFDAAYANFENARRTSGHLSSEVPSYVLILNDRKGQNWFERFRKFSDPALSKNSGDHQNWGFELLPDPLSLKVVHSMRRNFLYVLSGFQSVTSEGIEVLSLFTRERPLDGSSLEDTASAIGDGGGTAVLPWSPGKWIGERSRKIAEFIGKTHRDGLALGDVPSRLFDRLGMKHFTIAQRMEMPVLSGSDPLPIPPSCSYPGRFGTIFDTNHLDALFPSRSIQEAIREPEINKITFGRRESIVEFLSHQILLRIHSRIGKS